MTIQWNRTPPAELVKALRPSGNVWGQSDQLLRLLALKKTDLVRDLRTMPEDRIITWRLIGNPDEGNKWAKDRRAVVIYLGR